MDDTFTEVISESWFSRILGSLKGVLFGLLLIALAVFLVYWNEGRAVKTAKSLAEGKGAVVSVEANAVNPAHEKKLIHVSGEATTSQTLHDPTFALAAQALRLTRKVEMYQWKETEKSETQKKLGGGTETVKTYSYEKVWKGEVIPSSHFKKPEGHENSAKMSVEPAAVVTSQGTLGAFQLSASVIAKMSGEKPRELTAEDFAQLPEHWKAKAKLEAGGLYLGNDPAAPAIGDERVTFTVLKPGIFSVLARQAGQTFEPYPTRAGGTIERVEAGQVAADLMFQHAEKENAVLTWVLRLVGFLLMAAGIGLILSPISVFADVLPFVGDILGVGVAFTALVLGGVLTVGIIALAWIAVRPILGGALLAGAVAWFVFGKRIAARRTAQA